jgi:hypothetical protein
MPQKTALVLSKKEKATGFYEARSDVQCEHLTAALGMLSLQ